MRVIVLFVLFLLCILVWYGVYRICRFDIDLVKHPEKKKLLSLEDMFPNKKVAYIFRIFLLGTLGLLVFMIFLSEELSLVANNEPVMVLLAVIFFFMAFLCSLIQLAYTIRMRKVNGWEPVIVMIVAFLTSGGLSIGLLYLGFLQTGL